MRSPLLVTAPRTQRGEAFLAALRTRVAEPWDEPRPFDSSFEELKQDIVCQASPSKLAMLDAAASVVRPAEVYLEVGSYNGASLIAAAKKNPDVKLVAIDNFSQFGGARDEMLANLRRYGIDKQVTLIEGDYRELLRGELPDVGVYFFDGPHDYRDQYDALELAEAHLVDDALVIVDDTRWRHVSRANLDFAGSHPRFSLLCNLPSKELQDHRWWNGVQVFEYRRSEGEGRRDGRYARGRVLYGLIRPMRLYRYYYPARWHLYYRWKHRR